MASAGPAIVALASTLLALLALVGARRARRSERRVIRNSEARDNALAEAMAQKAAADQQVSLLVQLANRAQVLLDRQIDRFVELERQEADPAALDNLITLEQLALQARRSTEAALVVGGQANPRRWDHVVLLTDVVRAAVAEVDGYKRVHLVAVDDAVTLDGGAVADVAHLLAELIDSALMAAAPSGLVEVERHGANVTISHDAPASWATERAAVDDVVALLAARHGIEITRSDTTVLVSMPRPLISSDAAEDADAAADAAADDVEPAAALAVSAATDGTNSDETNSEAEVADADVDVTELGAPVMLAELAEVAAAPLRALPVEVIGLPSFETP